MCVILDTNQFSDFIDSHNKDMEPVRQWIEKKSGKLVYSPTKKLKEELGRYNPAKELYERYRRSGHLKIVPSEIIKKCKEKLPNLKSDDKDIIALALASKTKLLISADKKLHTDFKTIVNGKVYQNKNHEHLLSSDTCP